MATRRIHLHIGLPKTGSTAIQAFLQDNRAALEGQGFLYPALFDEPGMRQEFFLEELRSLDRQDWIRGNELPPRWAEVIEEIGRSKASDIILSMEGLTFPRKGYRSLGPVLKRMFPEADWQIIAFIRRQDDLAESLYKQIVRVCDKRRIPTFEEFMEDISLDYEAIMAQWTGCFGEGSLRIESYEDTSAGQSIIQRFLAIIGASTEMEDYVLRKVRQNPSLFWRATRLVQRSSCIPVAGSNRRRLTRLIRRVIDGKKSAPRKRKDESGLSGEERARIRAYYRPSNERLACRYLSESGAACLLRH